MRRLGADTVEVIQFERHSDGARNGEQVKHSVGGPAERHDKCDGVFKSFARHYFFRCNIFFQKVDDCFARVLRVLGFLRADSGMRRAAGQ